MVTVIGAASRPRQHPLTAIANEISSGESESACQRRTLSTATASLASAAGWRRRGLLAASATASGLVIVNVRANCAPSTLIETAGVSSAPAIGDGNRDRALVMLAATLDCGRSVHWLLRAT